MRSMLLGLVIGASFLSGCGASFRAYDEAGKSLPGIPVSMNSLATVRQITSYRPIPSAGANAALCTPDTLTEPAAVPSGKLYFVNVTGAAFASPKLDVTYTDAGTAKSISMNAENKAAEITKEIGGALTSLIPFVAAPKAGETPGGKALGGEDEKLSAQDRKNKYCTTSSVKKEIVAP